MSGPEGGALGALAAAPSRAPATALQAVESIRAWRSAGEAVFGLIQARVMEDCWVIARECPGEMEFKAFVGERLADVLDGDRAWAMAQTWDAARGHRELRELATRSPGEAVAFVSDFIGGGGGRAAAEVIGEHGREATRILTAPASKRASMVRDLLRTRDAAEARRHPDDARRIGELERENGQLREEARRAPPGDAVREAAAALQRMEREAAEIEERLRGSVRGVDAALRSRLLAATDGLTARIDRIAGQAIDHDEEAHQ